MTTFSISKNFKWQGTITDKVASVCRMFGLTTDRLTERYSIHECRLEIEAGDIIYLKSKFAVPLVFFVNNRQMKMIENALSLAGKKSDGKTKAEKNATALSIIADYFSKKTRKDSKSCTK